LAERYHDGVVALSPILATSLGVKGHDAELDDFSPAAQQTRIDLVRQSLARLDKLTPQDSTDQVTAAALRERLGLELELDQAGEFTRNLNNVDSPIQYIRDVFDLMETTTEHDWATIARRLAAVPEALRSYARTLDLGLRTGQLPAGRQVSVGIGQAEELAQAGSSLDQLAQRGAAQVGPALAGDLAVAASEARRGFADLAEHLATQIAPAAPKPDGVGRERYKLWSRYFLGTAVDLDQTYQWGLDQLEAITAEQGDLAQALYGQGTSVEAAYQRLDQDPRYTLTGADALERYMNDLANQAMSELDGTSFDLPEPVKRLEGRIAPSGSGGIYYTAPTEDFSRPGIMWWSVPAGIETFHTWRERTTVFHEGVPGHHLQLGLATYLADSLNRWRRLGLWCSGHGEGWALYAEALMGELGFMDDAGDRLGMLDAMRLRAARVALDIGVHLGKDFPKRWGGGGRWDAAKAHRFLRANVAMDDSFVDFELERYLGWPGQAPSYLIGLQQWQDLRRSCQAAAEAGGANFDLKSFHAQALALGSLGLDTLRQALLGLPDVV